MIIGFAGYSRAGKDTCADFYDKESRRAFADPLKKMCSEFSGIPLELFYDKKDEPLSNGKTPRDLLKLVGKAWRTFDPDVFVKAATKDLECDAVFSDVRMENECRAIQKKGGTVVFVDRPGISEGDDGTEQFKREWADHVVLNDSDIDTLRTRVTRILPPVPFRQRHSCRNVPMPTTPPRKRRKVG